MVGRASHANSQILMMKKEWKTVYQKFKCTDINITSGRKKVKIPRVRIYSWAENGIIGSPGSPQKPPLFPFWTQFTKLSKGCLFSNPVPMHLCIVLYRCYNYVCVLAEYSIKEGDFRCPSWHYFTLEKDAFYARLTNSKGKNKLSIILLKTYSRFLTGC